MPPWRSLWRRHKLKLLGSTEVRDPPTAASISRSFSPTSGALEQCNKIYSSCYCCRGEAHAKITLAEKCRQNTRKCLTNKADTRLGYLGPLRARGVADRQLLGPTASLSRARNFMNLITAFLRCNYKILLAKSGIFISFSLKYLLLVSVYKYVRCHASAHIPEFEPLVNLARQPAYLVRSTHNYSVIGPQSHKTSTNRTWPCCCF